MVNIVSLDSNVVARLLPSLDRIEVQIAKAIQIDPYNKAGLRSGGMAVYRW